jgi:tetrahydrodipicolinate N-succinyltransferase
MKNAQAIIDDAWENRDKVNLKTKGNTRKAVEFALDQLDAGKLRVASKETGKWVTHQWLKKAVLLSFRLNDMELVKGGPGTSRCHRNLRAGQPKISRQADSAPCQIAWCANRLISLPAQSSCRHS